MRSIAAILLFGYLFCNNDAKGTTKSTNLSGYWRAKRTASMPPSEIDFTYLAHINYAFYTPNASGNLLPDSSNGASLLSEVVTFAHAANTQVHVALGGASGSTNFTSVLSNTVTTTNLVASCIALVQQYDLDGLDLDYESPTNHAETKAAIAFLKQLRTALNKLPNNRTSTGHPNLSSFLSSVAYVDDSGVLLSNLRPVANQVDRFNMDTYDYNNSGNTTAPNAPIFSSSCKTLPVMRTSCANDSIAAYLAAGVPLAKLSLGVPFFARQNTAATKPHNGMICYPKMAAGSTESDIVYADALNSQRGLNWTYGWDTVARTGWAYNTFSKLFSATNWEAAVTAKAAYADCRGLAGLTIWSLDGDSANSTLTTMAAKGLAKSRTKRLCKSLGYAA